MKTVQVEINRARFLKALRSGNYKKGTIRSDERGRPIIESKEDDDGYCACAIMIHEFPDGQGRESFPIARRALHLTAADCRHIQQDINDTPLSFPQIADRIELEVFKRQNANNSNLAN